MDQRNNWVDYAKAIGIVLVVYGHVARGVFNAGVDMSGHAYQLVDNIIYSFHMPLFFFLSGLFFYKSLNKRGGTKLIGSKLDTIVYPYILWSIIQGSIEAFLSTYTNGSVSFSEVFSLLWSPRAQFWFLYALFFVFLLTAVIFSFLSKRFVLPVLGLSVVLYLFPHLLPDSLVSRYIAYNLVYFMLGVAFSLYWSGERLSRLPVMCVWLLAFISAQVIFHAVLQPTHLTPGPALLVLSLISIIAMVSISAWAVKRCYHPWVAFIGTASMAIYLLHILAGSGVRVALKTFMGVESATVHLVAGTAVGLIAPIVFLVIVNRLKIPFMFSAPISQGLDRLWPKR